MQTFFFFLCVFAVNPMTDQQVVVLTTYWIMRMLLPVVYTITYLEAQTAVPNLPSAVFSERLHLSTCPETTSRATKSSLLSRPAAGLPSHTKLQTRRSRQLVVPAGSALSARSGPQHHLTWPDTELGQVLCFCTILPVAQHPCSGSFALFCIISHHFAIHLYVKAA